MPPFRATNNANDYHCFSVRGGQGQDIAATHLGMRLGHALAVDADLPACRHLRAGAPAATEAGVKQPQIQALGGGRWGGRLLHAVTGG
ncbi:hypothetical protein JCM25156A_20680 [Komagataeibacter kakiaceti JCM 25156]